MSDYHLWSHASYSKILPPGLGWYLRNLLRIMALDHCVSYLDSSLSYSSPYESVLLLIWTGIAHFMSEVFSALIVYSFEVSYIYSPILCASQSVLCIHDIFLCSAHIFCEVGSWCDLCSILYLRFQHTEDSPPNFFFFLIWRTYVIGTILRASN